MLTYVAFIRGINVGGHNIVRKEQLLDVLASLGYRHVSIYKQSGNIILKTEQTNGNIIKKDIQNALHSILGKDIEVLLRSLQYLQLLVDSNPFQGAALNNASLLVTFLSTEPLTPPKLPFTIPKSTAEVIKISRTEAYSITHGSGEGALPNPFLEKTLKTQATTRNWNIIKEITQQLNK